MTGSATPVGLAALEELGLERGHRLAVLLADRLAQVVGLGPEKPASALEISIACSW